MKNDCVFCAIAAGEIPCFKVYEDDFALAYLDISPFAKGHTLVIPKAHAADIMEICMFRADTWIIETCRYGIHRGDLSIFILAEIGFHSVKNTKPSCIDCRSGLEGINSPSGCFTADQFYFRIIDEMIKRANRI